MRLAAIIPTLNEAATAPWLVRRLLSEGFDEAIVADGGSVDGTASRCAAAGAQVVRSEPGRGLQLAAGASASRADALFFVHADCRPPPAAAWLIRQALADEEISAGCFRLSFDKAHPLLRLYEEASRINAPLFTYGDQGLFVRRAVYLAAGGFKPMPLLEDLEIQRRLRGAGRFVKLPQRMTTSARRFEREGVLRRQLKNAWLVARWYAGAPAEALAREYAPERSVRWSSAQGPAPAAEPRSSRRSGS